MGCIRFVERQEGPWMIGYSGKWLNQDTVEGADNDIKNLLNTYEKSFLTRKVEIVGIFLRDFL